MYRARKFEARNQKAVPSVAMIVGITIASMMPVELSMMSRSAAATGPFGSNTPPEQPPREAAPINKTANSKRRMSDPFAGQESREQHKQIQDRKRENAMCRGSISSAAPDQFQRERNERRSANCSGCAIDRAGKSKRPRQQRNRKQHYGVDQDLSFGFSAAGHHRQHGDTDAGIFVSAIERQRPEMRWRPQEYDQEQDKRLNSDIAACGHPADHRRKRASCATDHDVL